MNDVNDAESSNALACMVNQPMYLNLVHHQLYLLMLDSLWDIVHYNVRRFLRVRAHLRCLTILTLRTDVQPWMVWQVTLLTPLASWTHLHKMSAALTGRTQFVVLEHAHLSFKQEGLEHRAGVKWMLGLLTTHTGVVDVDHVRRSWDGFLPWHNYWMSMLTISHCALGSYCFRIKEFKQSWVLWNGLAITAKFLPLAHGGLVEFTHVCSATAVLNISK